MTAVSISKDVIIIGSGPAGMSLACLLAKSGLNIAIIDKSPLTSLDDPKLDGRDIALTFLSKKILEELGAWDRIASNNISKIRQAKVLDGLSSYSLDFDCEDVNKDKLGYLVSNRDIKKAIYEKVKTISNIELFLDHSARVESLNVDKALVSYNGKIIESKLVVAADGRFSESRKLLGIETQMYDHGHVAIVCRMEHEKEHDDIAYECFLYGETLAVLPLVGKTSSIVITIPPIKADELFNLTEEEFNKYVENRFNFRYGKMSLINKRYKYPLVTVYAKSFISTRFALLGDAAVGMHPVTAHGYNLALKGAQILSMLLKSAVRQQQDIGGKTVLNSYQRQYNRACHLMYKGTNAIVWLYTKQYRVTKLMRKIVLRVGNSCFPIKKLIMGQLTDE
ncbi:MAG TPA: 5-demethoxyubiquinol-8 5-hydroxylase UbiM [Gammaproteobacteria bacterium]|nr:5-demethoxyubiquinol-8 5-hydroxylase UbiM [Gammaproteobacteria bacterium]